MQYYTSNVDFANMPGNYQPFSVVFGIGVAALAACSILIYKTCKYSYGLATREESRYIFIKQIPFAIRGKNLQTELVFSKSRSDNAKKNKIWFFKPIFCEHGDYIYNLKSATNEVYFGTLIVELLGNECTAKTKFNLYETGIVSRIPGDDATKVIDLFNFCVKKIYLPDEIQKHFIKVLILGIILENRDMRLENFVVALDGNNNPSFVYAIDHELCGAESHGHFKSLVDVLYEISINPKRIINLLMDKTFRWNYVTNVINFDKSVFDFYAETLLDSIDAPECIDVMDKIVMQLSDANFKICINTKQKILGKLAGQKYTYSSSDINKTISPTIDKAIKNVIKNVNIAKQFLELRHASRPTLGL